MIRAGLDSNILVYTELEPESEKGRTAQRAIELAAPNGILAVQSVLEFIAVVRRKQPQRLPAALAKAANWSEVFETAPTTLTTSRAALDLVQGNRFQVWDAVIWSALSEAGAEIFLTEDLQDGFTQGAMRARNPFAMKAEEVARLFDKNGN